MSLVFVLDSDEKSLVSPEKVVHADVDKKKLSVLYDSGVSESVRFKSEQDASDAFDKLVEAKS